MQACIAKWQIEWALLGWAALSSGDGPRLAANPMCNGLGSGEMSAAESFTTAADVPVSVGVPAATAALYRVSTLLVSRARSATTTS